MDEFNPSYLDPSNPTYFFLFFALQSGTMTAEEFHSALQEATNFPLRGFVLPYLKHTLPSLQRDLNTAARANNQVSIYKLYYYIFVK